MPKGQMYGRAAFVLLRRRIISLLAENPHQNRLLLWREIIHLSDVLIYSLTAGIYVPG